MMSKLTQIFILAIFTIGTNAHGQQNPYSFGRTCASQGPWTQRALAQSDAIITAINQLKGLEHCKGLESLDSLSSLIVEQMGTIAPEAGAAPYATRMESIPSRIAALQNYALTGEDKELQPSVLKALMKETLTGAAVSAEAVSQKGLFTALPAIASRSNKTFTRAADILEQITTTLPQLDRCLIGQAAQGTALVAKIIDLTASFASAGDGVHSRLGNSINNILKMLQKWKFSGSLRLLDQNHLRTSVACLMESTAEAYCSVQDAHHLLKSGILEYKPLFKLDPEKEDISLQHPLAGYYVLIHHLPNISRWIQKVQYGVEPQWAEDAEFKINSFTNVTNLQTSIWKIKGDFNSDLKIYYKASSLDDKKLALMRALSNVIGSLGGGNPMLDPSEATSGGINFFTLSENAGKIPFFLVGRSKIPLEVAQNQPGLQMMTWDEYMKGDGTFQRMPEFNTPDNLIKTINIQLDTLLQKAREKASDFYRERIIVNQPNLAIESLVSQAYSPHKSFKFIYRYLSNLDTVLTKQGAASVDSDFKKIIPGLRDTKKRLRVILDAYQSLDQFYNFDPKTDADSLIIDEAYKKVVKTVYDQLDVLWQRDSYLTNSLNNFIYADYVFRIKSDSMDLGTYEKDLLLTSGNDLLSMLTMVHSINPSVQQLDLATANTANLYNLSALHVFSDTLETTIREYNMIIAQEKTGDWAMANDSAKRLWKDTFRRSTEDDVARAERENPMSSLLASFGGIIGRIFMRNTLRPDLYPARVSTIPTYRPEADSNHHDIRGFRNQLCILSLAMGKSGTERIQEFCKGTVLTTNYGSINPRFVLNASYDNLLNSRNDKDYQERTVCAFRNFNRKNLVFWLTQNLTNVEQ